MMNHKPSPVTGGLIGGLLTLPLIVIAALANQIAGLAFFPFDLFDFMVRNLPGPLITQSIEVMVSFIRGLNLGRTDTASKLAEQLIGVFQLIVIGAVVGAVYFAVQNRRGKAQAGGIGGTVLGLIVGLPFALIASTTPGANPLAAAVWTLLAFGVWGMLVNAAYDRLAFGKAKRTPATATAASVEVLDRRQFLIQLGAATATITVVGGGLSALLNTTPNAGAPVPEATLDPDIASALPVSRSEFVAAPGTRPEITALANHYRIDIRSQPLDISAEGYNLPFTTQIGGTQRTLAELTLDNIRNDFEAVDEYITMSCISNPVGGDLISTIKWTGVPMQDILASMDVPEGATHLLITGGDSFYETVALDLINNDRRILLAYAWDDQPLLPKHGFPLRIHIPNLYGMKQPKWITGIEFLDSDQDGYWVARGWDKEAIVRSTSVIDTVAVDAVETGEDGTQLVPVGGIAWAGDRGIARVQVRVDEGEWEDAVVNAPISDRTWQLWRYNWPFSAGFHRFEVRCVEPNGTPQLESDRTPHPSGATGIHQASVTI
ncbi:MAG: molybdopterin-dependent oxidoreductase [Chloroflexi bacterium]|nr:molybdopterin-dependent oxidoreductase [Chloroflexota bacterium]